MSDISAEKLDQTKKKLASNGYSLIKKLGEGTKGIAYEMKGNKVLKITLDRSEAEASSIIVGKKLKHICEIYRVFSFKSIDRIYCIEQELLKPLANKSGNSTIFDAMEEEISEFADKYDTFMELSSSKDFLKKLKTIVDLMKKEGTSKQIIKFTTQIYEGLYELNMNGIIFFDMHPGNLGYDQNGVLKIMDLGYSKSKKDSDIEVLPEMKQIIETIK